MNGVFITFEGGEGAGKSTQMKRLAVRLEEAGHRVLVTREPGGSSGAEAVRHVILSGAAEPFGVNMEAILFAAARSDNVQNIIKPALQDGRIVLCDRFMDSSRVYQGQGGADAELLDLLEQAVTEDARPDLTLIFDLPPEVGMQRAAIRRDGEVPDRFEKETLDAQAARRQAYLDIAAAEPGRCKIIDAAQPLDEVNRQVDEIVDAFLAYETA